MKTMTDAGMPPEVTRVLDDVVDDRQPVVILREHREHAEPVVVVGLDDYESLREMIYLLRTPANTRRLLAALERLEDGQGQPHELLEIETSGTLVWDAHGWEDYLWWNAQDRRMLRRVNELLTDVQAGGNEGMGRPRALKHDFSGYWTRRVTDEHRLVYKVMEREVRVAACRYHYA